MHVETYAHLHFLQLSLLSYLPSGLNINLFVMLLTHDLEYPFFSPVRTPMLFAATSMVVAGPRVAFLPPEVDALKRYLDKGGKVMLMIDPPDKADAPPLANLIALSHEWGVDLGNNIVVDVSGVGRLLGTDETVPVAVSFAASVACSSGV